MNRYYLKCQTACDLYYVTIGETEYIEGTNWKDCIFFDNNFEREKFDSIVKDIKSTMESFGKKCKWKENRENYYVTTGYPSYFKNLHITSGVIHKQEYAESCQRYNYFETEAEANELLTALKAIFRKHNVDL